MKRITTAVFAIAACITMTLPGQTKDSGVAVVDMRNLVEGYWKYPLMQKRLKKEQGEAMAKVEEMRQDAMKLTSKLRDLKMQIKGPLLSPEAKKAKEKEFSDGRILLDQKSKIFKMNADRYNAQLRRSKQLIQGELMKEIKEQIRIYSEKKGLKLVVDHSAPISPVMFADTSLDITKEVLKLLNAGHEADIKKNEEEKAKAKAENAANAAKPAPTKE